MGMVETCWAHYPELFFRNFYCICNCGRIISNVQARVKPKVFYFLYLLNNVKSEKLKSRKDQLKGLAHQKDFKYFDKKRTDLGWSSSPVNCPPSCPLRDRRTGWGRDDVTGGRRRISCSLSSFHIQSKRIERVVFVICCLCRNAVASFLQKNILIWSKSLNHSFVRSTNTLSLYHSHAQLIIFQWLLAWAN